MPTSYRGLTIPTDLDTADGVRAFRDYTNSGPLPRFNTTAERDEAIPDPEPGMMCIVASTQWFRYVVEGASAQWARVNDYKMTSFGDLGAVAASTWRGVNLQSIPNAAPGRWYSLLISQISAQINAWMCVYFPPEAVGTGAVSILALSDGTLTVTQAVQREYAHPGGTLNVNIGYGFGSGQVHSKGGQLFSWWVGPTPPSGGFLRAGEREVVREQGLVIPELAVFGPAGPDTVGETSTDPPTPAPVYE